jgi:hypothetical protein
MVRQLPVQASGLSVPECRCRQVAAPTNGHLLLRRSSARRRARSDYSSVRHGELPQLWLAWGRITVRWPLRRLHLAASWSISWPFSLSKRQLRAVK